MNLTIEHAEHINLQFGEKSTPADAMIASLFLQSFGKQHSDDQAVDRFATAMKKKLAAARAKGRSGWDDPAQCTAEHLSCLLHDHVTKGDPVDVANYAMMLQQRGASITPPGTAIAAGSVPPAIGEAWPEYGGIYAGISRGEDGAADAHLVLLDTCTEDGMTWAEAIKWAESLGDGARLPTRFESALLYANLRDKLDTDNWHWTGTQYSDFSAWSQYFKHGTQDYDYKGAKARARAVRRFVL